MVRGQEEVADGRRERCSDERRRARVEAVEDDDSLLLRRAEDQSCDAAQLEAADLLQDVDAVGCVGAVDGEDLAHDFDFLFQAFVGDVRAAPRRLLGRKTAQAGGDRCARRRIRYTHFARQEAAVAFGGETIGEADAGGKGAQRFFARHGRPLGGVLRAGRDLAVDERGQGRKRRLDAEIGDEEVAFGKGCERVGDSPLGEQVVRRHLRRRLGRVGADLHFCHAVIGAADERAFLRLFERSLSALRRPSIGGEEGGECAQTDATEKLRRPVFQALSAGRTLFRSDGSDGFAHEGAVVGMAHIAASFGTCFKERPMRPRSSSTLMTMTFTMSPTDTTSSGCWTRFRLSSEMWMSPAVLMPMSTKTPMISSGCPLWLRTTLPEA